MAPDRRAALTAGVLFIAATAATLLSTAIEHPVLTGTDYLTRIAGNTSQVTAGGLLELVAAGASAASPSRCTRSCGSAARAWLWGRSSSGPWRPPCTRSARSSRCRC